MEYFLTKLKTLCTEIEELNQSEINIQDQADKATKMISKTLTSFRTKIRREGFASQENEIHFFKYVKPRASSYITFYSILSEIETQKLIYAQSDIQNLIDKKKRMFQHILKEHIEFVKYYRSGMTHLDRSYFLRSNELKMFARHHTNQLQDPEFNTSHDRIASDIMAFDLFKNHISLKPHQAIKSSSQLKWTGSKLDLVELIYALNGSGALNSGNADLNEISSALEETFQIKIGDLYRAFHDISNRKKEQIKFVNRLEDELRRKIDELEGM